VVELPRAGGAAGVWLVEGCEPVGCVEAGAGPGAVAAVVVLVVVQVLFCILIMGVLMVLRCVGLGGVGFKLGASGMVFVARCCVGKKRGA
jgi:hypothetical protein